MLYTREMNELLKLYYAEGAAIVEAAVDAGEEYLDAQQSWCEANGYEHEELQAALEAYYE